MAKKTARESILQEKTVKTMKPKVTMDQRFKSLKNISIISVVLVIAIAIVFNLIIDMTLDKPLTFDTSSVKSNTVSSMTADYLKTLEREVEIIGLFDRNDMNMTLREYFLPLLDDYEAKGDGKIVLKYIDPEEDPFILNELDPNNFYNLQKYIYVVKCGDRLVPIDPSSCFEYDADMYSYYGAWLPVTNLVEHTFTGNIVYVSSSRPLNAYYLGGHGLPSHHNMDTILKSMGFSTSELTLSGSNTSIPDDCELLMILQPQNDITLTEKEQIKSYLDNMGKVLIVNDYDTNKNVSYTNLNEVTRYMGATMEQGLLHENDVTYLTNVDDPYSSIAVTEENVAQNAFLPDSYVVEKCRYIKMYLDKASNLKVTNLVVTSKTASIDFEDSEINSDVTAGMYPVAMLCQNTSLGTKEERPSLLLIGTKSFTSDDYYSQQTLDDNNAQFIRRMLVSICPIEVENVIVPKRTVPSYILQKPLSASSATAWATIIMTVIPLGTLICGIYIYRRRRHL